MINLLVVEDEVFTRQMLLKFIDESTVPTGHVHVAFNGRQALSVMRKNKVDLVITDIKMAEMDGISFLSVATKSFPDVDYYVLSAFSEFPLVNNAYKYKIKDYLLKTELTAQQISDIMLNTLKSSDDKREEERKHLLECCFRLNNVSLKSLTENLPEHQDYQQALAECFPALKSISTYSVLCFGFSGIHSPCDMRKQGILKDLIKLKNDENMFEAVWTDRVLLVLLPLAEISKQKTHGKIQRFYAIAKEAFEKYDVAVLCGASGCRYGSSSDEAGLREGIRQAASAMEYTFYMGCDEWIPYETIVEHCMKPELFDENLSLSRLHEMLGVMDNQGEMDETCLRVNSVIGGLSDIQRIRVLFDKYYMYIYDYVKPKWYFDRVEELFAEYDRSLRNVGLLSAYNDWITALVKETKGPLRDDGHVVGKAKKYIAQHYDQKITLDSVAEYLCISGNYLGSVFLKREKICFGDYVTQFRINHAIKLMRNTNMRIYQIADSVGFQNTETFTRAFKRVKGVTPKEYIESGPTI